MFRTLFKIAFNTNNKIFLFNNLTYNLSTTTTITHPISKMGISLPDLLKKFEALSPLKLAESWDNVGLLVEPNPDAFISKALLTIDLTEDVVNEAIEQDAQLIISYHPNIFRPLKRVTQSNWKERIVTKCIQNNIAVFSPHTSWDAMRDGVNDWLSSFAKVSKSVPILPTTPGGDSSLTNTGMGRLVTLEHSLTLKEAVESVKKHIGLPFVRLGLARNGNLDDKISTVAVCAGSGASVFNNVKADLYLTGEMSHHEVLDATQAGIHVILCNHSDSERGFLKTFSKLINLEEVTFIQSKVDKDCLTTV